MRHGSLFAFGLPFLLLSLPALSQSTRFEVSACFEPGGSYSEYQGLDFDEGLGVGFGWRFASRWAADARALFRDSDSSEAATYQLGLRRSFLDDAATWRPFVAGGLHHRESESEFEVYCVQAPCPDHEVEWQDTGLFVGGGVDWQLQRWIALRFEGRVAIYESDSTDEFEDELDLTAGVAFKF